MAQLQATTVNGTLSSLRTENVQTGSYTLALSDRDKVVAMNNTSAATVTIPSDSTVNFPIGSIVYINRLNSGDVAIVGASGVAINGLNNNQLRNLQELGFRKRAANSWVLLTVF